MKKLKLVYHHREHAVCENESIFFHPDYTVGTGI